MAFKSADQFLRISPPKVNPRALFPAKTPGILKASKFLHLVFKGQTIALLNLA
jgi:hypothetical protein